MIYVLKSGDYFVRTGNEISTTLNWWKLEPFDFILQKKMQKKKNWFRNKEAVCLVPESEKQELLHSRTAGAEWVKNLGQ